MTMPCHITATYSQSLPWEKPEYPCRDCGVLFPVWRDHPFGDEIADQCPDCHAAERMNDKPEDINND